MEIEAKIAAPFADLWLPSRYKVYYGGRGGAKSQSYAMTLLIKGRQKKLRILCTREVQKTLAESVKKLLDDLINKFEMGGFYKSTKAAIRGENGTEFIFCGLRNDPYGIKSMEGIDICWVEEANTVSQNSLDLLIPTVRKDGSEIWFSYNPRHKKDPVHNMFVIEGRPDAVVKKVGYRDNPWFPAVLQAEMDYDKKHNPDKYLHVWEGEPVAVSDSLVFAGRYKIDNFEPPEGVVFHFGADWGFSQDPTVLVRFWVDQAGRKIYIDREAYQVGCDIDDTPELFETIDGSKEWGIIADSARPETISYLNKQGFDIRPAKKGPGSIYDGVEFLRSYELVIHERCKHVIDEVGTYQFKIDPRTNEILPVLVDANNHTIDALRYGTEPIRGTGIETLISDDVVSRAVAVSYRLKTEVFSRHPVAIGARYDKNQAIIYVRQGLQTHEISKYRALTELQFSDIVGGKIAKWNAQYIYCHVSGSEGVAVCDNLKSLGFENVYQINGEEKTKDNLFSTKRSKAWSAFRDWLNSGGSIPADGEFINQITNVIYSHDASNRLVVEKVESIMERGLDKPTIAEAAVLTFMLSHALDVPTHIPTQAERDWSIVTGQSNNFISTKAFNIGG